MTKQQGMGRFRGMSFIRGAFAVALALLLVLTLRGIAVQISPVPGPITEPYPDVSTPELCENEGGQWVERPTNNFVDTRPVIPEQEARPFCQGPLAFERERTIQQEQNQQTSLFVFAIGGGLALVAGLLIKQLQPVVPGLMLGGIVSFFIATVHIWQLAPGLGRLVTIIVIFLILTGVGVKVFRDAEEN